MNYFLFRIYIHITLSSKVLGKATDEFFRSREWPRNSLDLRPLDCHVRNEESVHKNQEEPFQCLEIVRQKAEQMWSLTSQFNIRSTIDHWKRRVQPKNQEDRGHI
jgi:hypothetical protein